MSEQKLALIDGTYPSLMAGGVVAVQGAKSDDLDNFKGSAYYGKSYYWPGGQTPSNAPSGANGGLLLVQRCGGSTAAQIFMTHRSTSETTPPVTYQRSQTSTDTWSDWEEIVTSGGNYPNMGAGYLAKRAFVGEVEGDQWVKWATVNGTVNTRMSIIFLVNGGQDPNNEGSGLLELNLLRRSEQASLVVCAGYLNPDRFCYVVNDTGIDLYAYVPGYRDYQIAVLDELEGVSLNRDTFVTFSNEATGSATAPSGAVYAIVRNNASADDNGYSFDTNYVWHNNGQVEENTLKDGTTSLDFNDYLEEGKYEVHGDANNPAVNFPTSSLNPSSTSCDWHIQVFRRSSTYVTQVAYSVRRDGAIAIRVLGNGTWGNWQLLFDNGVAQQVPAASQTQLGGAYIFKDSDGYLNINTEQ